MKRPSYRITGGGIAIAAVIAAGVAWYVHGPGPIDFSQGPKVALSEYKAADPTGVPATMAQAGLVERGEYLARAADCMVCHTAPGAKEYTGGFAFKLPFGTLYSTNITPDKETGIGNYTDQDFLNAVRRGKRHDGARLYPAMPYTSYTYMTDSDVLAVKAYLFSLPPVISKPPVNTLAFPFNQRWAMTFWSAFFNPDTRFQPDTSMSPEWNRGAYLVEALAHCGECHTPRNIGFALDNRKKFGGALTAGWRAFNISSDTKAGLGGWSDDDIVSYLSVGHAKGHGTASGPMGEAVDHSFSKLTAPDIKAMVSFLRSVPAVTSPDLPDTLAPRAPPSHKEGMTANALGKSVFEGACVSCHGWTGESSISPMATLTGAWAVNDPGATNVAQIVISGTKRYTPSGALSMPSFGNSHSDAEIAAVANYVTARFGSKGSKVTEKDVATLRKQAGQ
ncbi:cytochrome c [Tardiphaga sp. P9-11]|uniref:c-type cytochrome n=1 Tax=Tardiphaga sp. P9-11 TaxID=2024614 RepID=UPI0011F11C4F|nr:cytochrome c [Tardiphaga sp. P9-11]KAA0073960.1 cytochrome c [Tardiphaga sp. P9-11]